MNKLDLTKPLAYRGWPEVQVEVLAFRDGMLVSRFGVDERVRRHRDNGNAFDANQFDLVPLKFRVTEPGKYRCRNRRIAVVLGQRTDGGDRPWIGYVEGARSSQAWYENGRAAHADTHDLDLVEGIK